MLEKRKNVLVSIIVPVYNVEKYVKSCIDSIISQGLMSEIELILVDDGSTDKSGKIIETYSDCAVIVHKENGGLASARNAGLEVATGQWVMFVDSDDILAEGSISALFKAINDYNDADMIVYNARRIDEEGKLGDKLLFSFENDFTMLDDAYALKEYLFNEYAQYKRGWEAWSRLYRKSVIEQYKLRFQDTKKIFAEDLLFSLQYLSHTKKVAYICNIIYLYRVNSQSILGTLDETTILPRLMQLCLNYYESLEDKNLKKNFSRIAFQIINYHITHKVPSMTMDEIRAQLEAGCASDKRLDRWIKEIRRDKNQYLSYLSVRDWV